MQFDYIIVGAGSAGCVLADQLSAKGKNKVLLLEAGGTDARFWIKAPLGYGVTYADPKVNWRYTAAPDPGLNNKTAYWPRGRVVGGSSSINAMAYVRGLALDFDDWALAGATGWHWDNVRAVFERLETNVSAGTPRGDGPVYVSDMSDQMHPFSQQFLAGARDLGWPIVDDMNATSDAGISFYRSTVHRGLRWSAADAFLRPALKRGTVRLVKNALVERILFEGTRAVGVRYCVAGQQVEVKTQGEVILSSGAINSPQVLQLSGIGAAAPLRALGLAVVQNAPQVGQGLQDHLAITQHFSATQPTLNARLGSRLGRTGVGLQYVLSRKGPMAVPVNQVGGFVRSDPKLTAPNMQVYCNPVSARTRADGRPEVAPTPGFVLSVQPCRPTSRGEITLRSADPREAPRIQPNSLSTAYDRQEAVQAGRVIQTLARAPSIAAVTKSVVGPNILDMDQDSLLENFRNQAATNFHPTCTCRMGRSVQDSVVDARLRVHGVQHLRVVDASAFPNVTSGNTNAPTLMLAMRAASLILEDQAALLSQA